MRDAMLKLLQTVTMLFCLLTSAHAQDALEFLDGNWYSPQWKYGYVLKNGIGTATSSNSPNFQVGQKIIQLTATSHTTFSGRQVYTDGKFYNIVATLQADGRLFFQGEKNAKWVMERVTGTPRATSRPAPAVVQNTPAPRPAASYNGTTPLRCGSNVNCSRQAEVVQKMQMRWGAFSRSTHYGSACLKAIQTIRTMHPAAYGSGNAGFVQPQMDVCNLR